MDRWLQVWEESTGGRNAAQEKAAEDAIRSMDGDAALYLAKLIERWDPKLDDNRYFRAVNHAFKILGDDGHVGIPILLSSLRQFGENLPESSQRFRFVLANLSWIASGPEAAEALLRVPLLKGGEREIHHVERALTGLLSKGNKETQEVVHDSLNGPLSVRALAALSLAKSGQFSPKVVEVLSEALSNDGPVLLENILASTSTMADSRFDGIVEPLFRLLSSEHDFASEAPPQTDEA